MIQPHLYTWRKANMNRFAVTLPIDNLKLSKRWYLLFLQLTFPVVKHTIWQLMSVTIRLNGKCWNCLLFNVAQPPFSFIFHPVKAKRLRLDQARCTRSEGYIISAFSYIFESSDSTWYWSLAEFLTQNPVTMYPEKLSFSSPASTTIGSGCIARPLWLSTSYRCLGFLLCLWIAFSIVLSGCSKTDFCWKKPSLYHI